MGGTPPQTVAVPADTEGEAILPTSSVFSENCASKIRELCRPAWADGGGRHGTQETLKSVELVSGLLNISTNRHHVGNNAAAVLSLHVASSNNLTPLWSQACLVNAGDGSTSGKCF